MSKCFERDYTGCSLLHECISICEQMGCNDVRWVSLYRYSESLMVGLKRIIPLCHDATWCHRRGIYFQRDECYLSALFRLLSFLLPGFTEGERIGCLISGGGTLCHGRGLLVAWAVSGPPKVSWREANRASIITKGLCKPRKSGNTILCADRVKTSSRSGARKQRTRNHGVGGRKTPHR